MQKKVAVILSGCGVYDGAEIHESVITLLRLSQRGAQVQCFAPDIAQHHVVNHLTGEEMAESRNVLVESARIARGDVKDVRDAKVEDFDALVVPGGFGAAKNLSDFAFKGDQCEVQPDVLALAKAFAAAKALARASTSGCTSHWSPLKAKSLRFFAAPKPPGTTSASKSSTLASRTSFTSPRAMRADSTSTLRLSAISSPVR